MTNYPNPHPQGCFWHSYAESYGAPNIKWCEETLCSFISEPANAWSNVAYFIAVFVILYLGIKNQHHSLLRRFPVVIFLMGLFSFVYHLSNFYGTQIFDFVGMFFLLGWTTGFNFIRLGKLKRNQLWIYMSVIILSLTGVVHIMYLMNIKFQLIMAVGAVCIVITEVMAAKLQKIHYKWFVSSLGMIALALGISILDHTKVWCTPSDHGLFSQGHALWHWLSGLGMIGIYLHYSQDSLEPTKER